MARNRAERRREESRPKRLGAAWWVLIALLVGALVFVWAQRASDDGNSADRSYHPLSAFGDIHGIAVNPEDPNELYVATHYGLIRGVGDGNWSRVGSLQNDYMGFSMHPTNGSVFWTSGHPSTGGNMGVRQSTDGGFTWKTLALDGVDFHGMTVSPANPDHLWGMYAGKLYRTTDGGHEWTVVSSTPPTVGSLAADPSDAEGLYVSGQRGIYRSDDGGANWKVVTSRAAAGMGLHPTDPQTLYAAFGRGLERSTDGGATWSLLDLETRGGTVGYLSFDPTDPETLYAATYQSGIFKTTDGGATWRTVKAPEG